MGEKKNYERISFPDSSVSQAILLPFFSFLGRERLSTWLEIVRFIALVSHHELG